MATLEVHFRLERGSITKGPSRVIRCSFLELLARYLSPFVGMFCLKLAKSSNKNSGLRFEGPSEVWMHDLNKKATSGGAQSRPLSLSVSVYLSLSLYMYIYVRIYMLHI